MIPVRRRHFRVLVVGRGQRCAAVAAGLAELGHEVGCRVRQWDDERGEPGLVELVRGAVERGRLSFTGDLAADVLVVCGADQEQLAGARSAGPGQRVVVNTCASPWESTPALAEALGDPDLSVVSNPIEPREGSAVRGLLEPERIVVGGEDERAIGVVAALYRELDSPVQRTDIRSADLIAPAANAYCAVRRSYFEQLAGLCAAVGADVHSVVECLRYDDRIECDGALLPERAEETAGAEQLLGMARGASGTPMLRAFVD